MVTLTVGYGWRRREKTHTNIIWIEPNLLASAVIDIYQLIHLSFPEGIGLVWVLFGKESAKVVRG